jgi:hypothetical protein
LFLPVWEQLKNNNAGALGRYLMLGAIQRSG